MQSIALVSGVVLEIFSRRTTLSVRRDAEPVSSSSTRAGFPAAFGSIAALGLYG